MKWGMSYEQVKDLALEPFKRLTGVKPETFGVMVEALRAATSRKLRSGRPSKLRVEDQLLMTLIYLRENRTYFHIGHAYGVNASTAYRIVRHVEDVLSDCKTFRLPSKRQLQASDLELSFVIVDVTETPIERPKKSSVATTAAKPVRCCFKAETWQEEMSHASTGIARP